MTDAMKPLLTARYGIRRELEACERRGGWSVRRSHGKR